MWCVGTECEICGNLDQTPVASRRLAAKAWNRLADEMRGRRSLEQAAYQDRATSVANRAHCRRNPRGEE